METLFSYSFCGKWILREMAVYRCLRAVGNKGPPQTCWLKTSDSCPTLLDWKFAIKASVELCSI